MLVTVHANSVIRAKVNFHIVWAIAHWNWTLVLPEMRRVCLLYFHPWMNDHTLAHPKDEFWIRRTLACFRHKIIFLHWYWNVRRYFLIQLRIFHLILCMTIVSGALRNSTRSRAGHVKMDEAHPSTPKRWILDSEDSGLFQTQFDVGRPKWKCSVLFSDSD